MKEPYGKLIIRVETSAIVVKIATVQIVGKLALATQDENLFTNRLSIK